MTDSNTSNQPSPILTNEVLNKWRDKLHERKEKQFIAVSTRHKHDYRRELHVKIMLRGKAGTITGYDILKQRKCECGDVFIYSLERTKA